MSRVLVVDDKEMMRDSVGTTLSRDGHIVVTAPSGRVALDRIREKRPDVVVTDLQMPEMSGLELLGQVRAFDEQLPVVFMTAFGTVETAVEAMKQGAFDYITKPFSRDELVLAVQRAIKHAELLRENQILRATAASPGSGGNADNDTMIGDGPGMSALRDRLDRIAGSHGTVLIGGESGAGKEVAARWIHANSPRRDQPFLALNCAALSTSLLESELFGHEKGAFTGADRLRKGRFELADGGTLLLDEISEIAPEIQAKLLRVLQERAFERVGASQTRQVDVRVIATTNRDLPAEVARGCFRQDLFFRLNVLPVYMPPLRDRPEDIVDLSTHFLSCVAQREGRPVKRFLPEAVDRLRGYGWPGNVRELQNVCERAAVLAPEDEIEAALIAPWLGGQPGPTGNGSLTVPSTNGASNGAANGSANGTEYGAETTVDIICDGQTRLEDIERQVIIATLRKNNGHRQRSAVALGIGVRTLGLKLKKWKEMAIVAESL